ncbi:hypothetical protein A9Q84_14830 [Halobacteriovorax marinus]|uniref:Uncharacterized protein n=1 Tax=Halobacteriovorax marinus TaxID=97084 RepID=A0A1Y5FAW0_9BACT|nr:hypothetical protein A9Q84_14830 [Halobacteriovorax marinus]
MRTIAKSATKKKVAKKKATSKKKTTKKAIAKKSSDKRVFPQSAHDKFMANKENKKRYEKKKVSFELEYQMQRAMEGLDMDKTSLSKKLKVNKSEVTRKLQGGISKANLTTVAKYASALNQTFIPLIIPKEKEEEVMELLASVL